MATHAEGGAVAGGPGYRATALKPAISRRMLLFFIIGDILGGGIYALVGEVGDKVGGAFWTAFALAGVVAAFTAASYAELVSKYPLAGGAALFVHKAFRVPLFTFLIAFAVVCSGLASAATLATAFGGDYLSEFVDLPEVLVGLGVIAVLSLINFRGIKESVSFNMGCTLIELSGLVLVAVIGAAFLLDGGGDPGRALEFKEGDAPLLLVISGASLAFYALIGFEDSVNVAEETQSAPRAFPGTLFLGLGIAGSVYLLVTVIASMAVPTDTLAGSDGPLLEVVQVGPLAMNTKVFSAIALFALVNGALINMVMASRLLYGMAQQGVIPPWFGRVHPGRRTPWAGILLSGALAAVLVVIGDLETLADTTVLLLLIAFVAVHVAVLVLRRDAGRSRALPRVDRVPRSRRALLRRADHSEAVRGRDRVRVRGRSDRGRTRLVADRADRLRADRRGRPGEARRLAAFERGVDRDVGDARERARDDADLASLVGGLLERLLVKPRDAAAGDQIDLRDRRVAVDVSDVDLGVGVYRLDGVTGLGQRGRELHREAARLGGADQLLRVRACAFLEAGLECEWAFEGARAERHTAVALLEVPLPLGGGVPCSHRAFPLVAFDVQLGSM